MHAWIHRHRHQLRALYGMPPEPRIHALLERARKAEREALAEEALNELASEDGSAGDPQGERKLRQHTLRPRRRAG